MEPNQAYIEKLWRDLDAKDKQNALLSAEVERLRGALEGISAIAGGWCDNCRAILDIARRAMEGGR